MVDVIGSEFSAFVEYARKSLHMSQAELARQLGCGRNQITDWKKNGCPKYIALACSAIVCKLPPMYMP